MKEKKLSKDELIARLKQVAQYLFEREMEDYQEVVDETISLIEAQAEPSEDVYEYALGILNKLDFEGLSLQEKVNLLVKSLLPGQRPNEEWIEEKANKMGEIVADLLPRRGTMNDPTERCKDFLRKFLNEAPKPKVNREWVYYFCAYINAGHKSPADDKARVEHAIKKLKEAGMEVEDK